MFTGKKTIIIAEACENHFGSIKKAKKMIINEKKSGADFIKFQHHIPEEEILKNVPKSNNFKLPLFKFLKKNSLSINQHYELFDFCKKVKIKYLCTPFSLKAAQELSKMGVDYFKIGSGEFTDIPFIESLIKLKKPTIFSTGMSNLNEIDMMYNFLKKKNFKKFCFLNFTSEYPPNYKDLNLGFIRFLKNKYKDIIIGHSDHTDEIYSSIAAVSMGARIIEKHVYLDKNYGPDRNVSINFKKFSELVKSIRLIERSLGEKKKIYQEEKPIFKWARRSLITIKDIYKNEKLTRKNLFSKRPALGIASYKYYEYLGKKTNKFLKKNTLLKNSDIIKK